MLIGSRWVEKTRLKILNTNTILGGAWAVYPGLIQTNLSERGLTVGLTHLYGAAAASLVELQVLFDGQPPHQGFFRFNAEPVSNTWNANQQPCTMPMPQLDIPEDTEVTLRGRIAAGAAFNSYIDLYAVVYYLKDWEAAQPSVCFPTDVVPRDPV